MMQFLDIPNMYFGVLVLYSEKHFPSKLTNLLWVNKHIFSISPNP